MKIYIYIYMRTVFFYLAAICVFCIFQMFFRNMNIYIYKVVFNNFK